MTGAPGAHGGGEGGEAPCLAHLVDDWRDGPALQDALPIRPDTTPDPAHDDTGQDPPHHDTAPDPAPGNTGPDPAPDNTGPDPAGDS